jgi:hypothetical protein
MEILGGWALLLALIALAFWLGSHWALPVRIVP